MQFSTLVSLAASLSVAAAQYKGFNYGSTHTDGSAKTQADFEAEFAAAKVLAGTTGFTSARLYTTIQAGTDSTPILAIPAAIAQQTRLLLGLWASGGDTDYQNELAAVTSAISTYGSAFTNLVIGISVGSEDLYRTSSTGIAALAGVGTTPDVLVRYIADLRTALASTSLSTAKVTHVDTYNAWTNGSNSAVVSAVDFLSMDVYPYFQKEMANGIENGASLFDTAYQETVAAAQGKEVWVTETGWPVSGPDEGAAVASVDNAKLYWDQVGCNTLFGKVNTFWYILQDALPTLPSPSFGLVGAGAVSQAPLFNLTCPAAAAVAASSAVPSSSSAAVAGTSVAAPSSSSSAAAAGGFAVGAVGLSAAVSSSSSSSAPASGRPVFVTSSAVSARAASAAGVATAAAPVHSAGGASSGAVHATSTSVKTSTTAAAGASAARATTAAAGTSASVPASTSGAGSNTASVAVVASVLGLVSFLMTL